MRPPESVLENLPLAPLTTFEVGGPARFYAEVSEPSTIPPLLTWAREQSLPVFILGGGSNVLVSDTGFNGLVLRVPGRDPVDGLTVREVNAGDQLLFEVDAGVSWDALVAVCVERGAAGVECLSGIPGRVGAAPVQNIGAYGQDLAATLRAVSVVDIATGAAARIVAGDCGLEYRASNFRHKWRDRFLITSIEICLRQGTSVAVTHPELEERLGASAGPHALSEVRNQVLALRREKSMLHEPTEPNRRSAGSFFVNPIVSAATADGIARRAKAADHMPLYPAPAGQMKLSAAWLIERAGFGRGYGIGPAGLSTKHTLALINRGGATAADVIALAKEVRTGVQRAFGVLLEPEPVFVGFPPPGDPLCG